MFQQVHQAMVSKTGILNIVFSLIVPLLFSLLLLTPSSAISDTNGLDKNRSAMMKYRKLFMETKGNHAKAIKLLVKNKLSLNHIVSHGEALVTMADDMLLIFPAGSMGGKSRAMKNIWDEQGNLSQDFKNKVKVMRIEAARLVDVAEQGNYKAIKKQMATFVNKGCRSCHSDFRGE
jgi:cytochrome c556